ncbi:hypothetical protein ACIRQP_24430 [Streptomyces sp. NPDC102274]|uniref:hypothetical protein n=1 Tax=Streptomyces sp. NPDC102274 TaxID=3366151 RepID=UPI0038039E72
MRIRTALAATALAATALLGGASSAFAGEDHDLTAAAGGLHAAGGTGYYENLGGDAGITDAGFSAFEVDGWFGFLHF